MSKNKYILDHNKFGNDYDQVFIEYDLEEIFGQPITDPALRLAIGQEIIDRIVENTDSGQGVSSDFKSKVRLKSPYSNDYAKSLDFQAFGKSKRSVDMQLTGDMLRAIDILDHDETKIRIGFNDSLHSAKAHGHINGANYLPKRDFFGITFREIEQIKDQFEGELAVEPADAAGDLIDQINRLAPREVETNVSGEGKRTRTLAVKFGEFLSRLAR